MSPRIGRLLARFALFAALLVIPRAAFAACGDGVVDGADACDLGAANGMATSCCNADCTFRGVGMECRATAGPCDVAETCTGAAGLCPADAFLPSSTVCRPSAGTCDIADHCSGTAAACTADAKWAVLCRAST